ncbi:MAG: BatD family protein [Bradymonadia bacterium]
MSTSALRSVSVWALALSACLGLCSFAMAQPKGSAQKPSIQVQVSARSIAYGQTMRLRVVVRQGGRGGGDVEMPPLGQWSVTNQSRQMRFDGISGQRQTTIDLTMRPEGVGDLTIGAFSLKSGGQVHKSQPVTIKVTGDGPAPPSPQGIFGDSKTGSDGTDELVFLRWEVDKENPWLGEQVNASLVFYVNRRLSINPTGSSNINLEGFWNQPVNGRNERARTVTVNGRSYVRQQSNRYVLFPLKAGQLSLPEVEVSMDARAGFGRGSRAITRTAPELKLEVKPLPSAKRPKGFSGPAVGRINLIAKVDRTRIKGNQGVQLTILTRVKGLLQNVPELELPDLPGFKVFDPTKNQDANVHRDQLQGTRTATWLLRPTRTGKLKIPQIELPYFDPVSGKYRIARTRPLSIEVSGEVDDVATHSDAQTTTEPGAGLRTIRGESSLATEGLPMYASPLFVTFVLLPPMLFGVLIIRERMAARHGEGAGARAVQAAAGDAQKVLGGIASASGAEGFMGIAKALNGYLGQRFGTPVQGLTRPQLMASLKAHGLSDALAKAFADELENCDFARFAPTGSRSGELQEALGRARGLIEQAEQELS